jgi:hypothetical protein
LYHVCDVINVTDAVFFAMRIFNHGKQLSGN